MFKKILSLIIICLLICSCISYNFAKDSKFVKGGISSVDATCMWPMVPPFLIGWDEIKYGQYYDEKCKNKIWVSTWDSTFHGHDLYNIENESTIKIEVRDMLFSCGITVPSINGGIIIKHYHTGNFYFTTYPEP